MIKNNGSNWDMSCTEEELTGEKHHEFVVSLMPDGDDQLIEDTGGSTPPDDDEESDA